MWQSAHDAYLESRVLSANPLQLVNMLYQAAIAAVKDARRHLANREIAARARAITKACTIMTELTVSLNHEAGGDLSRNLHRLYDYIGRQLIEANFRQADQPLEEVLGLLSTLVEGWEGIQPGATPEPQPATPEQWEATSGPQADAPQPWAITPEPRAATPGPWAVTPEPKTATPAPWAVTPEPRADAAAPWAATPEPRAVTPGPWTVTPESRVDAAAPWAATPAPRAVIPGPWAVTPESRADAAAPWAATPGPWADAPEPRPANPWGQPQAPSETLPEYSSHAWSF